MSNKKYGADHFRDDEFECNCGCGLNEMSLKVIALLDLARKIANIPFVINSACRCIKHNRAIKGNKNSSHLKGLAVDIRCLNSVDRLKIVWALLNVGFKRIGIAKNYIHVDLDRTKPECIYLY